VKDQGLTHRTGPDLFDTNAFGADLTNSNFTDANLTYFEASDLTGSDLQGADISGANFSSATLTQVKSGNVTATEAPYLPPYWSLYRGYLLGPGTDFSGADLANWDFSNDNMSGDDLSGTNLTGANLTNDNLAGANVRGAIFTGVIWPGVVDIRSVQKLTWDNKLAKGFNTTDVPLELCLLNGEIAEAFDAWRKGRPDLAEELADAALFLVGLAQMVGADLREAVEAKLAKNAARAYQRLPDGVLVKSDPAAPPE